MNKITQLSIKGLDYSYPVGDGINRLLLQDLNIEITCDMGSSTFASLIAPFGSGKSTLLKLIGGLIKPINGKILFDSDSELQKKTKAVLINEKQNFLPWLSVKKNIKFTLQHSDHKDKRDKSEIERIIDLVGLKGYEDHIPNSKSSGFIFRIALANALMTNPDFILLDEPFRKFNSQTRSDIYEVVQNLLLNTHVNFILAATNVLEAIFLSDTIFLMKKNPGSVFDIIKIDRSMLSEKKEINDYVSKTVTEIQNKFNEKIPLEIINFSL